MTALEYKNKQEQQIIEYEKRMLEQQKQISNTTLVNDVEIQSYELVCGTL
jgi:hypothetical protein